MFNIYLLYKNLLPGTAGSAPINANEKEARRAKKNKGVETERAKQPTPTRAIGALTGEEEQYETEKRTKRKKQEAGPQPNYPGPSSRLLRCEGIIR